MARLNPLELKMPDGRIVKLRSPERGEGAALLETVSEIMRTSEHLLTEADEFTYTAEQEEDFIKGWLESPDKLAITAECGGRLVGLLTFGLGTKRRNSHAGEFGLSLLPKFQGLGIGKAMLHAFLDWARAHPRAEKINLRVYARNHRAIKLYLGAGFHQEGLERKGVKFRDGTYDDVLNMSFFVK